MVGEELGGVDIFIDFLLLIKPNETPSTNLICVEGGMIRYIHEVTVYSEKNCGR